jgi:hypothetical protein
MRNRISGSHDPAALKRALRTVVCATAIVGLAAGAAQATATQGTLGATSTGVVNITATVLARTQISGLSDVTFTNVDPGVTQTATQNDCVWSNTATKGYTIKASGNSGNGSGTAFLLASGSLAAVPYSVSWAGTSGASSGTGLVSGTTSTGFTSTATQPTCQSGAATTSTLFVSIAAADLQTMTAAASYTGTLTLLVTPQ